MTQFIPTALEGVIEIRPAKFGDSRGFFSEVYKRATFEEAGIHIDWMQDNQSYSAEVGTVRGLHLQAPPFAQDKLVRVLRGAIYDVAVDIRAGSPTYGKWVGVELSAAAFNQLLVPQGFAHGFMTLTPDAEVHYKVSAPYSRESERAIIWNDPDIGIDWPDVGAVHLSDKDKAAETIAQHIPVFTYGQ